MADMRSFDRRRKIADALLAQSMTPGQGGQMVGRYYVGSGLTDGLTKLGQALIARSAYKKADEEESAFNLESQQKQQAALDELVASVSPREEAIGSYPVSGNMVEPAAAAGQQQTAPITRTIKPSPQNLALALMNYQQKSGQEAPDYLVNAIAPSLSPDEFGLNPQLGTNPETGTAEFFVTNKRGQRQFLGVGEAYKPDIMVTPGGKVIDKRKLAPGASIDLGISPAEQRRMRSEEMAAARAEAAAANGDKKWAADQEGKLRDDYRNDTKQYKEVLRQADIITKSLADPSAAGTLAAATSFMKMLDPGSVVRESELGMAMQSTGALDRYTNYVNVISSGQVLTAQQKEDFARLASQYAEAAKQAMENLNTRYSGLADSYGLNAKNIVEFAPAAAPGDIDDLMKKYGGK